MGRRSLVDRSSEGKSLLRLPGKRFLNGLADTLCLPWETRTIWYDSESDRHQRLPQLCIKLQDWDLQVLGAEGLLHLRRHCKPEQHSPYSSVHLLTESTSWFLRLNTPWSTKLAHAKDSMNACTAPMDIDASSFTTKILHEKQSYPIVRSSGWTSTQHLANLSLFIHISA